MKKLTPPREFKAYIDRMLEYLQPRMQLSEYIIKWKYVDKIGGTPGLRKLPGTHDGYTAQVEIDFVYLCIDIDISVKCYQKYKGMEYATIAQDILHELSHTYLEETTMTLAEALPPREKVAHEWLRKVNENNTEKIARTIFATMPREIWHPYKK